MNKFHRNHTKSSSGTNDVASIVEERECRYSNSRCSGHVPVRRKCLPLGDAFAVLATTVIHCSLIKKLIKSTMSTAVGEGTSWIVECSFLRWCLDDMGS